MSVSAVSKQKGAPARQGISFWLSAWLPVAFGIGIIALESTQLLGADHTSGPLRWLFEAIFGIVSNARWDVFHSLIRKSGHFFGYGALGLVWLRAWWMTLPNSRFYQDAFLALLGTALVASLDEWHQSFLPNRTGSVSDVLLDCQGAIVLLLVVYSYMRIVMPRRLARAE
ncbi:MAG: VanZ family protein [Terracidiphilus sp.]